MTRAATLGTLATVVGFLAFVEFTSGVLQGYYTPMLTDIARHLGIHDADVNWLEGAQLMLSALVVPAFAKLGDMVGHKRMLLISTLITGAAAFVLPFTDSFADLPRRMGADGVLRGVAAARDRPDLVAVAADGGPVGHHRPRRGLPGRRTRDREPSSARSSAARSIDSLPLTVVLLVPAILIVVCFFVILFGVKESPEPTGGVFDTVGLVLDLARAHRFTGGLSLLRLEGGLTNPWSWAVVAARDRAGVAVRAVGAAPQGPAHRRADVPLPRARPGVPHRRPVRSQRARRAGAAVDLRPHGSRPYTATASAPRGSRPRSSSASTSSR